MMSLYGLSQMMVKQNSELYLLSNTHKNIIIKKYGADTPTCYEKLLQNWFSVLSRIIRDRLAKNREKLSPWIRSG